MRAIRKILDWLDHSVKWFGTAALFTMLLIAILDLFFRDILLKPISWSLELLLVIMLWLTMTNSAVGVRDNLHIRVEFFIATMPRFAKDLISLFTDALIIYYALVTVRGNLFMAKLPGRMSILRLHYGWMYYSGVVCGFLLIVFSVEKATKTILRWFKK